MLRVNRLTIALLALAGVALAACGGTSAGAESGYGSPKEEPAKVEPIEGSSLHRVILTPKAAERIGIQTAPVRSARDTGNASAQSFKSGAGLVIPYHAVLYDPQGDTWVYTNPTSHTYVRHRIEVARITGKVAVLKNGPPAGTPVVTVGAQELFGTEFEFEE